jgi:hypothetical protein
MGEHVIVLRDIRPVDIHGSKLLDLVYYLDGDPDKATHQCRIGPESVVDSPAVGERYVADFALRQMTRVRRIAGT